MQLIQQHRAPAHVLGNGVQPPIVQRTPGGPRHSDEVACPKLSEHLSEEQLIEANSERLDAEDLPGLKEMSNTQAGNAVHAP